MAVAGGLEDGAAVEPSGDDDGDGGGVKVCAERAGVWQEPIEAGVALVDGEVSVTQQKGEAEPGPGA